MDEEDRAWMIDSLDEIGKQLKRIADCLEARDKEAGPGPSALPLARLSAAFDEAQRTLQKGEQT